MSDASHSEDKKQELKRNKTLERSAAASSAPTPDPFEIDFLPQFQQGRGPREAFVNEHGVVIGDHEYESDNSPLTNWTENTDPAIMSGDEWVHPYKDVGFHSDENRDYFERGIEPQTGSFMHADKDVAYDVSTGDIEEPNQDDKQA